MAPDARNAIQRTQLLVSSILLGMPSTTPAPLTALQLHRLAHEHTYPRPAAYIALPLLHVMPACLVSLPMPWPFISALPCCELVLSCGSPSGQGFVACATSTALALRKLAAKKCGETRMRSQRHSHLRKHRYGLAVMFDVLN